jgi:hypothetical protein
VIRRDVYRSVPDLSWPGWERVARPLYARLIRPATTDEVVAWGQGSELDVDGGRNLRESYVRNILAWLSVQGMVDHVGGKWRRLST